MTQYCKKLHSEIESEKVARYTYRFTKELFIDFFSALNHNPVAWHRNHQEDWAAFLLEKDYSASVLKKNRQFSQPIYGVFTFKET